MSATSIRSTSELDIIPVPPELEHLDTFMRENGHPGGIVCFMMGIKWPDGTNVTQAIHAIELKANGLHQREVYALRNWLPKFLEKLLR